MPETKTQRLAKSYLAGAMKLLDVLQFPGVPAVTPEELEPVEHLIGRARELVDGRADKRERKNAGDRKRRAKKKGARTGRKSKRETEAAQQRQIFEGRL